MSGAAIHWQRAAEPALLFHVLAHLDLGHDAASLFDETLPERPWAAALREAYAAAPGRLQLHALGLWHRAGIESLREAPPAGLRDPAGRRLLIGVLDAMASERAAFMRSWEVSASEAEARRAQVAARLTEPLGVLRQALWEPHGDPPALTVLDCPALDLAGRATSDAHGHIIAVNLAAPIDHLLCQIFHEEVHPVTDPIVRDSMAGDAQDTRVGTPGHALHVAIEHAAIVVGEAVIEARAPAWREAYTRWRARFG